MARTLLAIGLLSIALVVSPGSAARASACPDQTWPRNGSLQTSNWPGSDQYTATLQFALSQSELCALQQAAPYLEVDFDIRNFDVPAAWENYTITGTNLPGGMHDVAYGDPQYIANPAVTRIYTSQLLPNKTYYATLRWTANARAGMAPYIVFGWNPSHWSFSNDPVQNGACLYGGNFWPEGDSRNPNDAWCIFPREDTRVTLFDSVTFAGGWPAGQLPLDGFRWYDWSPSTSVVGSSTPAPLPPAPQSASNDFDGDHRSDLMILHKLGDNGFNMHNLVAANGFAGTGFVRTFPASSAWNWNLIKTATGDVNNDGVSDLLLLHRTGDGGANFYVFYGGSSQFAGTSPVKQFPNSAGWNFDQMKLLAGDYDGDRKTDVMILHKLVDGGANMYIYNQTTGFAAPGLVRAFPGSAAWNWNLMSVASGDVNYDGVSDLMMLHGTGDGGANYYVFYGANGQFANAAPVKSFPGSAGWVWASMKMLAGDYDGDHHADLMFLHKTGDNGGNLYIFNQAVGFNSPGLVRQFPGTSGWNWSLMKLGSGDVNNDGVSDLTMLHRTGDGGANYYTILGGSGQFIPGSPARQLAGSAGWAWDSMILPTS